MNPFDENVRHNYIISTGGLAATTQAQKEAEIDFNCINVDLDTPIYRYMKWDYLKGFYDDPNHEWILARPCLWQDRYEHFIFKCEEYYDTAMKCKVGIGHLADNFFAQCWTLVEESSMQWQVNKPHSNSRKDNDGNDGNSEIWVKVRTTPRRLLGAMFYSANNPISYGLNQLGYFIGKVEYLDSDFIKNFQLADTNQIVDSKGLQQVLFLLQKRKPYEAEQEVRLVMQVDYPFTQQHDANAILHNKNKDLLGRHIDDWYELIDEIVLDPWVDANQKTQVEQYLQNLAQKENKSIIPLRKSDLNDAPQYMVPVI